MSQTAIHSLLLLLVLIVGITFPLSSQIHSTLKGLTVFDDPASANGARWTYKDTVENIEYDLTGILFMPSGPGPFPAVILSHGGGDNVSGAPVVWAKSMVQWGCVCIAVNYSFSSGVPKGAPGVQGQKNLRSMNILRAHKCRDILASFSCVDTNRIAAHGFSMGAFTTDGLVGMYPLQFKAASHAGGGLGAPASATQLRQTNNIVTPFQIHHGVQDTIILFESAMRFDSILQANKVPHQLYSYPNYGHMELMQDSVMLERIKAWYTQYGLFDAKSARKDDRNK
jgi:dienelactone hydrolase